ncbi:hypothetical protein ATANTOWER_003033 [Ataeniobius toweri]|uniref:Uncharacterized protein n=1 Tax=Ataeniobius toweri TaxID=208326 RepID=A0ABU7ACW4_9TELE|nr:hypothetical protein [Ataeniobius toweri]
MQQSLQLLMSTTNRSSRNTETVKTILSKLLLRIYICLYNSNENALITYISPIYSLIAEGICTLYSICVLLIISGLTTNREAADHGVNCCIVSVAELLLIQCETNTELKSC